MTVVLLRRTLLAIGGMEPTDISDSGSHADLYTGITLFSQLALKEFVELGVEDSVCDELSPLGDRTLLSGHVGRCRRKEV